MARWAYDVRMDPKALGQRLRAARKSAGLPMRVLAERTQVTERTAWRWEKGDYAPNLDQLITLAATCGTTVSALIGEDGECQRTNDGGATA